MLAGDEPLRLLSAPEQLLEIRRMLKRRGQDGGARWPERLRAALATRGFAEEVRDLLLRAAERGLDGRGLRRLASAKTATTGWPRPASSTGTRPASTSPRSRPTTTPRSSASRRPARPRGARQRERGAYDVVLVDEYQDSDPAQDRC